jgi:hypothetical protein
MIENRVRTAIGGLRSRILGHAARFALVERVAALDRDDELYLAHLREPFFQDNAPPDRSAWVSRWCEILEHAALRPGHEVKA